MEHVRWTKEELKTLDTMTRKALTMNGAFHSKCDVDRLYVSREDDNNNNNNNFINLLKKAFQLNLQCQRSKT